MLWAKLLPRKHEPRWNKRMGKKMSKREMIPNRVSILERPSHINDKTDFIMNDIHASASGSTNKRYGALSEHFKDDIY